MELLQKEQRIFERFPYAPVENCGANMLVTGAAGEGATSVELCLWWDMLYRG